MCNYHRQKGFGLHLYLCPERCLHSFEEQIESGHGGRAISSTSRSGEPQESLQQVLKFEQGRRQLSFLWGPYCQVLSWGASIFMLKLSCWDKIIPCPPAKLWRIYLHDDIYIRGRLWRVVGGVLLLLCNTLTGSLPIAAIKAIST